MKDWEFGTFSDGFVVIGFPGDAKIAGEFDGGGDVDDMCFDSDEIHAKLLTFLHVR